MSDDDSCNKKNCILNKSIQKRLVVTNAYPFMECPYYDKEMPGCRARDILGNRMRDAFNNHVFTHEEGT